jgi:hypothetical protein
MAAAPEFITMHEVAKRKMIPWAESRVTVTRLFKSKQIKYTLVKQGKNMVYLTTPAWVKQYMRRELKGKI